MASSSHLGLWSLTRSTVFVCLCNIWLKGLTFYSLHQCRKGLGEVS